MRYTLYEQGLTQSVRVQPSVRAEAPSSILKCYLKSLFRLSPFRVAIVALNPCKTEQRWWGGGGGGGKMGAPLPAAVCQSNDHCYELPTRNKDFFL